MTSGSCLCLSFCACSPSVHVDLLRVFSTLKDGSVHDELFLGGKEWVNGVRIWWPATSSHSGCVPTSHRDQDENDALLLMHAVLFHRQQIDFWCLRQGLWVCNIQVLLDRAAFVFKIIISENIILTLNMKQLSDFHYDAWLICNSNDHRHNHPHHYHHHHHHI